MQTLLAIILGRAVALVIKFFRLGAGSAAPGLYALKIDPDLVSRLSRKISKNIIITGTNGKTTTARMISHFAKSQDLRVISNNTGSNLERGIASTLIHNSSFIIHNSFDLGVWEIDEASFNTVAPKLNPDIIVFLNVFRDQLDRYGEIDTIVKKWSETLKKLDKKTIVLTNGDDANTLKLTNSAQKFGVKDYKIIGEQVEKTKDKEDFDFEAKNVKLRGFNGTKFQISNCFSNCLRQDKFQIDLPLPGIYHIYDFLAAFSVGINLGFDPKKMINSLKTFSPAFGRVEKLPFGYIFLIKNPAGATQVFDTIAPNIKSGDRLLLALNDNIADGTDVSWIWDINLENIKYQISNIKYLASGGRAYDMALRLKYEDIDSEVEPDLEKALKQARSGLNGQLFILPTYTAMLELQSILAKLGLKKKYWETE